MWLGWMLAVGMSQAAAAPLTIGGGVGPALWLGELPSEYSRTPVGRSFSLELGVPVRDRWTVGGGVGVSLFSVGVPYSLQDASRRKELRFDMVTPHVDVGRSWAMGDRAHLRVWGGPAFVSMVAGAKGGTTVLDCTDDDCVEQEVYNTSDDRLVVDEVETEAPFGWSPGGRVATGVQWQAVEGEQGLVLSADVFAVISGPHPRSGLPGTHMGLWLGAALGGPKADSGRPTR